MTVKDLIKKLNTFDQDMIIGIEINGIYSHITNLESMILDQSKMFGFLKEGDEFIIIF